MSLAICECGWAGTSDDLETIKEGEGDDVSLSLNRCPDCGEFVLSDDDEDGGED